MPFRRVFLFLLVLLLSIYLIAYVCGGVWSWSCAPDLATLPGFRQDDSLSQPAQISPDLLVRLEKLDSLHQHYAHGEESVMEGAAPRGGGEIPPPPIPAGTMVQRLEYDARGGKQLAKFFNHLARAGSEQVRVLHLGDSQIEGDRITSFVRSRLQATFTGAGVGLVSATPNVYLPYGLSIDRSPGWTRRFVLAEGSGQSGLRFGILGVNSVCSRLGSGDEAGACYSGAITLRRRLQAGRAMRFSRCRIFYRAPEPVFLTLRSADSIHDQRATVQLVDYAEQDFRVGTAMTEFSIELSSLAPIEVYGLSLESPTGVVVDNIALRGSQGIDLGGISDRMLQAVGASLSPRLILLQFGVNVVPARLRSYAYYQRGLSRLIARFQQAMPTAAIIVLGVSDMAEKQGMRFVTYDNLPLVKRAQRQAALDAGVAFWDMQEAMGGRNSIVSWVQAENSLATADYVHFTPRGARLMGELLYTALMAEYNDFKRGDVR